MADTANIGKLVVDLLLKDEQFQRGMKSALGTTQASMPKVQQVATSAMGAVTKAFKAATVAVTGFGAASTAIGAQFEQQMAMVGALRGLTQADAQFQALEKQARKLGATTEFTATQAAEGLEELARAGASVEEAIASSESALVLAGTSAAGLADSTQLLVATQRQFGMEATESKRITDVFSAAMRGSLLDFSSLREAMKFAGTAGASFGMSLEETTAAVAAFRDLGLEGSLAGTNFRMAMIAAAQGTDKQARALEKYGLTLADINPETNTFVDIVEKIGEVGITASDAVQVFGSRAGANVAQLAAQTRVGAVDMRKFTQELEGSSEAGKDAASMYETIGQTVSFQTKVAISALQDLMIAVFQTYAEPLRKLIETLPQVFNAVSKAVQDQGPALKAQFADTLGAIGKFLRDNAENLATAFVSLMQVLAELGPVLTTVAQVLVVIARNADAVVVALSGAMMIGMAVKFAAAVNSIALAFGSASTAITVFGTTLTVTTGGMLALVLAIGAAVAGLTALIGKMMSARDHTEQLREAQEALEQRTTALADAEEKRLGAVLDKQQARIRDRLASDASLDDATRRRLESTLRLTAAEARQQVVSGKLVEVNGELRDVRQFVAEQGEDAASVLLDLADLSRAEADAIRVQTDEAERALAFMRQTDSEREKEFQTRRAAIALGLEETASLAQVEVKLGELSVRRDEEATKAKALRDRVAKGTADAVKAEVQAEFDAQQEVARARGKGADDAVDKREQATKKIEALMARLVQASAKAGDDEVTARQAAYRRQLATIEATFQERLALEKKGSAEYNAIDAKRLEARKMAEETAARDITAIREKERAEEEARAERLAEQVRRFTQAAVSEAVQLERDKQEALTDLAEQGASERQLAEVGAAFDERIGRVRADAERRANDLLLSMRRKALSARERLEREKAAKLEQLADASAEVRAKIEDQYDRKIRQTIRQNMVGAFKKAGQAAADFGKAAAGAAMGAMGAISGLLNKLSGFQFSLTDAIGGAVDAQNEALDQQADLVQQVADAEQRLAEATVSGDAGAQASARAALEEAQAALKETETALADGMPGFAKDFVDTLIADAAGFAMALAEGAGPALTALADQLPIVIDAVIQAIPTVVQAIVDNVPRIIFSIVDALPALITALVDGLTTVIVTLLQQLPALLTTLLTDVLPTLIVEVAAALPVILQALVDALPLIIEAIVNAIPVVIGAIVDALPDIITAVVRLLPEIIGVLLGAIPQIAIALVTGIVTELIPAIPSIIAHLFKELIAGMGAALRAVAEGIWNAIKGFFNIFKKKDKRDSGAAFDGISYVPATMRMTLHRGEAVVPADRNAEMSGATAPAPAGAAQNGTGSMGGGSQPIDIAVMAEGRLLDAVQIVAARRGHATGVVKEIRRAGGVRVGLSRGKFSAFSTR